VGLSRVKPRQGRFARLLPGFVVFVLYYALLVINQNAILGGVWPAAAGMWPVHGLFLLAAVHLVRRSASPPRA
jgi:lipopolysaccharide export system permease protein